MNIFSQFKEYFINNVSSNKFKFTLIIYAITFVHSCYVLLFAVLGVLPLFIFNIGSVTLYIICSHVTKYGYERDFFKVFYAIYIEVILHCLLATIFVGWSLGFSYYTFGLVPFCYYVCVTMMDTKYNYLFGTLLGLAAYITFIVCRTISLAFGSVYNLDISPVSEFLIYAYNTTSNFAFLFVVVLIFIMDMQATTDRLHIQNAKLDNMASIDPLTGLYNRRSMQGFLDNAAASDDKFCLVMCDIDNFKKVNDTYGHDFGDVVLKEIASIILHHVDTNGNVCRWGGEEILILINGSLDTACQIAENIRKTVENHAFSLRETTIYCTLTLGIASHSQGATTDETITRADGRLYYGKQNGKNRVVTPFDMA